MAHYYILHRRGSAWTQLFESPEVSSALREFHELLAVEVRPWLRPSLWRWIQKYGVEFELISVVPDLVANSKSTELAHYWFKYVDNRWESVSNPEVVERGLIP